MHAAILVTMILSARNTGKPATPPSAPISAAPAEPPAPPLPPSQAPAVATPTAAVAAFSEEGMPHTAILVEARFAGSFAIGAVFAPLALPSLMVGARLADRVHVGLAAQYINLTTSTFGVTGAGSVFALAPTAAVDIVKSANNRGAFYGRASLGFGASIPKPATGPAPATNPNQFVFSYEIGAGVRYALLSMFTFGMEAGFNGVYVNPGGATVTATNAMYAALVGTFMYGL